MRSFPRCVDGCETLQKVANAAGFQNEAPRLFVLNDQANAATVLHAQGAAIAGTQAQADIVAFETNLYTAPAGGWTSGGSPSARSPTAPPTCV